MARALILGKGASGEASAALLRFRGYEVAFADGCDLVVSSPGICVRSELQVGCEELKRRGWRLLAVTGSKGKSSVVKVVTDAINLAGGHAVACGNYGRPVSDVAASDPETGWAVVEVSSFQLETTCLAPDTFEAAAILNLQEDHLDRHGGVEAYHAVKRRLLAMAKKGAALDWPAESELLAGSYFDNEILRSNGSAACWLMSVAGVPRETARRAFAAFAPLPHRMNLVAEIGGVRCIDDSKATSLAALEAGVRMAGRGVRLIAGGQEKGDDPKKVLSTLTERVKKVYIIGRCAEKFHSAWKSAVDCEVCGTMEAAVAAAMRDAEKGETVLLSPGTASYDQFQNYGERGEVFANLVKKEGQRK